MSIAPKKIQADRQKKIKTVLSMMNRQNQRLIPVIRPLVEMMDMTASDDELDFLIRMGTGVYDYDSALDMSNRTRESFEPFFDDIIAKGLVHVEYDGENTPSYRLNAVAVGWYEVMMLYLAGKPQEKAFSEKWDEFFKWFRKFNVAPLRHIQNIVLRPLLNPAQAVGIMDPAIAGKTKSKTIPINTTLPALDPTVYPTFHINEIIDNYGKQDAIYAFPCVCRHGNRMISQPCRFDMPGESCIVLGDLGRTGAKLGYGRKIDKDEAIEILRAVREKGAIHSIIHEKDDCRLPVMAICNCCWDCCGILKHYNMGAVALKYKAFYVARIKDDARCKGCGNCAAFCPTTAATVVDKQPVLDPSICIGCGQCAFQCRQNNIELYPESRTVFLPLLKPSAIRVTS